MVLLSLGSGSGRWGAAAAESGILTVSTLVPQTVQRANGTTVFWTTNLAEGIPVPAHTQNGPAAVAAGPF